MRINVCTRLSSQILDRLYGIESFVVVSVGVGVSVGGIKVGVAVGDDLLTIPGTNQNPFESAGLPPLISTVRIKRTFFPACSARLKSIFVTSPS